MEWRYKIAPFITSALIEQNGLTVLWAIDHLMDVFRRPQSFYLPEVNLYKNRDDNDKNEVDLLAVIDREFIAAEVKLSAASFVDSSDEIAKFIDELKRLAPDKAFLICEQYCQELASIDEYKSKLDEVIVNVRESVPNLDLKVIVASNLIDFNSVPNEIGPLGDRTDSFFQRLQ